MAKNLGNINQIFYSDCNCFDSNQYFLRDLAKMKKILGLCASPRKLGNSEIAIKEICLRQNEEVELRLLRLDDMELQNCHACYKCLFEDKCVIEDDISEILKGLAWADGVVVASPTYFLSVHSNIKKVLDRGLSFYSIASEIWHKPAVGLAIAGIEGKEGSSLLGVETFLKSILADIKNSDVIYAAFPGEIIRNEDNDIKLQKAADSLFGERTPKPGSCCPLCGGDSFRFLGGNKVKCMLCSNSGEYLVKDNGIKFSIHKDEHELFLSEQVAEQHKEWLKEMKNRFFAEIPELKKIRDKYK
jgi:multimeric flavodoxin WrbA